MEYLSDCCKAKSTISDEHTNDFICSKCGKKCIVVDAEFSREAQLEEDYRLSEVYMAMNNPNFFEL